MIDRLRCSSGLMRPPSLEELLLRAASDGETAKVGELVAGGADINCMDETHQTPLLKASGGALPCAPLLGWRGACEAIGVALRGVGFVSI